MADPLIELMGKILTHIPEGTDISLTILKGHLIIEEELNNALNSKVKTKSYIENARLSFNQLLLVTKAHYINKENSWCWGALIKLNKIRNSLSHYLEPEGLNDNLVEFINLVEAQHKNEEENTFHERLRHALAMVAAQIHELWRNNKT